MYQTEDNPAGSTPQAILVTDDVGLKLKVRNHDFQLEAGYPSKCFFLLIWFRLLTCWFICIWYALAFPVIIPFTFCVWISWWACLGRLPCLKFESSQQRKSWLHFADFTGDNSKKNSVLAACGQPVLDLCHYFLNAGTAQIRPGLESLSPAPLRCVVGNGLTHNKLAKIPNYLVKITAPNQDVIVAQHRAWFHLGTRIGLQSYANPAGLGPFFVVDSWSLLCHGTIFLQSAFRLVACHQPSSKPVKWLPQTSRDLSSPSSTFVISWQMLKSQCKLIPDVLTLRWSTIVCLESNCSLRASSVLRWRASM